MSKNDDCYFYYYSTCTRGLACPYRHEPAALQNEETCKYWRAGNCAKPNCMFRHLDVSQYNRKKTNCYWEKMPGGCKKPFCPFNHTELKQPLPEEVTAMIEKPQKKIIINKNKVSELNKLILPMKPENAQVIEANSEILKPSPKERLGSRPVKRSIKERLGSADDEKSPERMGSLKSDEILEKRSSDIRKRLGTKMASNYEFDDDDVDDVIPTKRLKSVIRVVRNENGPIRKIVSNQASLIDGRKKLTKHRSLADEIASRRDRSFASADNERKLSVKSKISKPVSEKIEMDPSDEQHLPGNQTPSPSPSPPPPPSQKKKEKKTKVVKKAKKSEKKKRKEKSLKKAVEMSEEIEITNNVKKKTKEEEPDYLPIGRRKLNIRGKRTKQKSHSVSQAQDEDELGQLLSSDNEEDGPVNNKSVDVMKELDELLSD